MSISLTKIQLVQASFNRIAARADEVAQLFYGKLFQAHPELRSMFRNDMALQRQKLMDTLAFAMRGLDDISALVPELRQLALDHLKYGVQAEQYDLVGNTLLEALAETFGPEWTPELQQAWGDIYWVIAKAMRLHAYGEQGHGSAAPDAEQ